MLKSFKWILPLLFVFLSACGKQDETQLKMESYRAHYHYIENNTKFLKESNYFHVSTEIVSKGNGFAYYIVVDQARVEMHDVVLMVVENDELFQNNSKMMPSSGIFDQPSHLIPNQVNKEYGYRKGIVLSGESQEAQLKVELLVEWKDKANELKREYLSLDIQ